MIRWGKHRWEMELPPGKLGEKPQPYEPKLLRAIQQEGFKGTAFDVGAYWGNHSVFMAEVCGLKVHAFEADPDRARYLRRNAKGRDIVVHQYAVGDGGTAHWVPSKSRRLEEGGSIPVHRIDDILDVDDLAVVKLDIEGMEPQALAGMIRHLAQRPVIYSETHDNGVEQARVLEPLGYRVTDKLKVPSPMWRWA